VKIRLTINKLIKGLKKDKKPKFHIRINKLLKNLSKYSFNSLGIVIDPQLILKKMILIT